MIHQEKENHNYTIVCFFHLFTQQEIFNEEKNDLLLGIKKRCLVSALILIYLFMRVKFVILISHFSDVFYLESAVSP
jgi:hypothetical protein